MTGSTVERTPIMNVVEGTGESSFGAMLPQNSILIRGQDFFPFGVGFNDPTTGLPICRWLALSWYGSQRPIGQGDEAR